MLCVDDVWSFEGGVLAHLNVNDAIALSKTCKYFARVVVAHCKTCRHLWQISSDEIAAVTNPNLFSSLKSFASLRLRGQMDVTTLRRLLRNWTEWDNCHITTKNHTRKALIMWLTRIRSVEALTLDIDPRDAYRMVKLKNAFQSFVRRNTKLGYLQIRGVSFASVLTPFFKLQLRELHLTTRLTSCAELGWIASSMPQSVERLVVRNVLTPYYTTMLTFWTCCPERRTSRRFASSTVWRRARHRIRVGIRCCAFAPIRLPVRSPYR